VVGVEVREQPSVEEVPEPEQPRDVIAVHIVKGLVDHLRIIGQRRETSAAVSFDRPLVKPR
jgi:hypothetical protein